MRETRTAQTSVFDFYSQHERSTFFRNLSERLDRHPQLHRLMEPDLRKPGTRDTGRKGLSVESVFRCLLLKQITRVSYHHLSFLLTDSPSYRCFARLGSNCFPSPSTLCTAIRRLRPETLHAVFEQLSRDALAQGELETQVMRLDSTVVKSNIAPPSDSRLLDDGIRVLSRLMAKSQHRTGVKLRLTDYRVPSRQLAAGIFYGKKAEKDVLYRQLIPLAKRVVRQCHIAVDQVKLKSVDPLAFSWMEKVKHYQQLLERVIDQTERRVFHNETVPAAEKMVSLFEPHTDIIVKANRGVEYGHKINVSTNKQGLITVVMLEQGNPRDSERLIPLLETHQRLYGKLPTTTIADGCYASHHNVMSARALGVEKVAFHKKNGITLRMMGIQAKTLKKLKDFRAGIEANLSELKRAFGAGKALWKGESGFTAFVWASVISYNLTRLVRLNSG